MDCPAVVARPARPWRPRGMYYRVELTPPQERTAGGIYLPEGDLWRCNDGRVTALGDGRPEWPGRCLFQAQVGERVLFERMDLEPGINEREGVISDEDLVGIVTARDPGVQPCGEWLLIELDGWKETTGGGLAVPERYRNRKRSGVIRDYGPGRLIKKGPRQGLRETCSAMLDGPPFGNVAGKRVYFSRVATLLFQPGSAAWYLVRCRDLVGIEEPGDWEAKRPSSAVTPDGLCRGL